MKDKLKVSAFFFYSALYLKSMDKFDSDKS